MYKKISNKKQSGMLKKHGSILVYCVIILAMMLVIASGMSFVTINEKKDAATTEASAQAIQTADSGLQMAVKTINTNLTNSLATAFGSSNCSNGIVSGTIGSGTTGSSYQLTFQGSSGAITNCSAISNTVTILQSTGTYKNTVRSVSEELSVGGACPSSITANGVTYGTVTAEDGNCWLDRNLGASEAATSATDSNAYGWYFQWGRGADGHQVSNSATTVGFTANCTSPGSAFILLSGTGTSSNGDWCYPQNGSLWQQGSETNNPCPTGFRVPTQAEWFNLLSNIPALNGCSSNCLAAAYNSKLKLTAAGIRQFPQGWGGSTSLVGTTGIYWASDTYSTGADDFGFAAGGVTSQSTDNTGRAQGLSVRCIAD